MTLSVDVVSRRGAFEVRASFEAAAGETLALLGPNGSGKSTLVAAIAGLTLPASGSVVLDGHTLDDVAAGIHVPPERRPVGVVFQDLLLFPHLSSLENAAFRCAPRRASGVGPRSRGQAPRPTRRRSSRRLDREPLGAGRARWRSRGRSPPSRRYALGEPLGARRGSRRACAISSAGVGSLPGVRVLVTRPRRGVRLATVWSSSRRRGPQPGRRRRSNAPDPVRPTSWG
jgi:molybdate transport system ATP-binding protein